MQSYLTIAYLYLTTYKTCFRKNFKSYFSLTSEQHQYVNRRTRLNTPTIKTTRYGSNSITLEVVKQWNTIQNSLKFDINYSGLTRLKLNDKTKPNDKLH